MACGGRQLHQDRLRKGMKRPQLGVDTLTSLAFSQLGVDTLTSLAFLKRIGSLGGQFPPVVDPSSHTHQHQAVIPHCPGPMGNPLYPIASIG